MPWHPQCYNLPTLLFYLITTSVQGRLILTINFDILWTHSIVVQFSLLWDHGAAATRLICWESMVHIKVSDFDVAPQGYN